MAPTDGMQDLGSPEASQLEASFDRDPGPGEVRLKVEAIGIDRVEKPFEVSLCRTKSTPPPQTEYDVVGVVEAIGPGVTKWQVGHRVVAIPAPLTQARNGYTDLAVFPVEALLPWPAVLDKAQAAALWTPWLTAWGGLVKQGGLRRGQIVLVTAAARSTALAAFQIVRAAGAIPFAVVRHPINPEAVVDAGAAEVIATGIDNLRERLLSLTGDRGADLAFDGVGGPHLESVAEAMAYGGRIVLHGYLDDPWTHIPIVPMLDHAISLHAHSIHQTLADPDTMAAAVTAILEGVEQGR
jgi:NADPH:quinone reductase-like Zn-dependent oxidoreductase